MVTSVLQLLEGTIQASMVIMSGVYFIFSNAVMVSLQRFENGADVMVEINEAILNPLFVALFCVSGLGSLYFALAHQGVVFFAGVVFFLGTTLVTAARNVPLNNQLRDSGSEREGVWNGYLKEWVFWNHVRSVAGAVVALLLVV